MSDFENKNLKNFQHLFVECVLQNTLHSNVLEDIIPIGSIGPKDVIDIYRNDYKFRLHEALGENYETTWAVMGDDDFNNVAFSYIEKNPSSSKDLTSYGKNFPLYLKETIKEEDDNHSLLFDLSNFEKLFWELFHKPAPMPVALGQILNFAELNLEDSFTKTWKFHEHIRLVKSEWKIFDLFKKRSDNLSELNLDDFHSSQCALLYKEGIIVKTKLLTTVQYEILFNMVNGLTPEEAMMKQEGEFENDVQDLFQFLSSEIIIVDFA